MPPLNVLIAGSGIAGTAFAMCLLRAHPTARITIVERDPALRLTGASVDIRSTAVDIIKWLGVEAAIRARTTKEAGIQIVDSQGRAKSTLRATGRDDIQSFTSEYEIFRGELAQIFAERIEENVDLVFNETVKSFVQRPDGSGVDVTFTTSGETRTYDLLVGADGLGSKTRGMLLHAPSSTHLYDEGVHVAYFTLQTDLLHGSKLAKWFNAPGGRALLLRPDPHPEGRTRVNLMIVAPSSATATKARLNAAVRAGNEAYMALMEEMFAGAGWLTPEVLRGMRQSEDFYCSLFGQVRAPRLGEGRVVLLGDAGYATPGFGTSLAIMGAYVLAGELLSKGGEGDGVEAAVEAYAALMHPFVRGSQGGEAGMLWFNPQTRWGIWMRNLVMGGVTGLGLDRLAVAAAAALGVRERKMAVPEYAWPAEYGGLAK